VTLSELNALEPEAFVRALESIFEGSPWVPESVADQRPFSSRGELHEAMSHAMRAAPRERQLELIRAHPELARRARMTPDSVREQAGAGLDRLTLEEFMVFQELNAAYRERFGFPFILAVKGRDKTQIREALEARVSNAPDVEFETSLAEIEQIAGFRLEALIPED
jgi:2-oxo-4-hydroxy-4-carboxy-5-ureidoimidazoline decarboxylase